MVKATILGALLRKAEEQHRYLTHAEASLATAMITHWLPRSTHGWRIHSIGCFTGRNGAYSIAVLTQDNPTMNYGITTVQAIAWVINRDLNPGTKPAASPPAPAPARNTPDEKLPPCPVSPRSLGSVPSYLPQTCRSLY